MLCSSIYINTRVQADPKGFAVVRVKKKYKLSRAEQKMKVMLWNMAQDLHASDMCFYIMW